MEFLKSKLSSPLWVQLIITLLFIAVCVAFIGGEYIRTIETPRRLAHAEEMVLSQLAVVAVTTRDAVIAQDLPVIETAITGLASISKDIHSMEIINADNKVMIDWQRRLERSQITNKDKLIFLTQPFRYEGEGFGVFRVGWDASATHADVAKKIEEVRINIFLFMFVTATVLLIWMHQLVIRPVMKINQRLLTGSLEGNYLSFSWVASEFQVLADSVKNLEAMTISKDELEDEVERRKSAEVAHAA